VRQTSDLTSDPGPPESLLSARLRLAGGYVPLIGDGALRLGADTPLFFDPWGEVRLEGQ